MGLFDIFKRKKTLSDYIDYYELTEWWQNRFTDEEREYITKQYEENTFKTILSFLTSLYKNTSENYTIQNKIESKLYDSFDPTIDSMVLEMDTFYKEKVLSARDEKQLVGACYIYINYAPRIAQVSKKPLPSHLGFKKLTEVLEKEGKYEEFVKVCEKALAQGWAGKWEERIEKYKNTNF